MAPSSVATTRATPKIRAPYHQWSYDLKGNLQGIPFKRGVNREGGMPKDFKNDEHGLRRLMRDYAQRRGIRLLQQ